MAAETLNPEEQKGRTESELDIAGAWAWLPNERSNWAELWLSVLLGMQSP